MAWRRSRGGGPILINLIHEIDLIRFVCGEIASVQAFTSNAVRGFEVEDTAAVLLRLTNGALATDSLSDTAVAPWTWDLASGELSRTATAGSVELALSFGNRGLPYAARLGALALRRRAELVRANHARHGPGRESKSLPGTAPASLPIGLPGGVAGHRRGRRHEDASGTLAVVEVVRTGNTLRWNPDDADAQAARRTNHRRSRGRGHP